MKKVTNLKVFLGIVFFQLSIGLSFGQVNSGKITYKVLPPESFEVYHDTVTMPQLSKNEHIKALFKQTYEKVKLATPMLQFELIFNKDKSLFKSLDFLANDNDINLSIAAGNAGIEGTYYIDLKNKVFIHQLEHFGRLSLVKGGVDRYDWKITGETKMIQGYKCYKATADYEIAFNLTKTAVAWFTPDLPFSFGPIDFVGLPGLVLGLERNNFYIYADKIKLNSKNRVIKTPARGEQINEEEYLRQVKEKNDEMFRRYEEVKDRF